MSFRIRQRLRVKGCDAVFDYLEGGAVSLAKMSRVLMDFMEFSVIVGSISRCMMLFRIEDEKI